MKVKFFLIYFLLTLQCSLTYFQVFRNSYQSKQENFVGNTELLMIDRFPQDIIEVSHLPVPNLIAKYGYPCEVHHAITEDGYILEIHRIPYGRNGPSENRPAVFVQHGILSSSSAFLLGGPEKSLGFVLADAGYDVWLGNIRGSTYSRKHVKWHAQIQKRKYWDFSYHEVGVMDMPAMIDYVIDVTNQDQIFYIGHSMGITVFYVMCSEKPEYNHKIKVMFSLAGVAYTKFMKSPILRVAADFDRLAQPVLHLLGVTEFLPHAKLLDKVYEIFCTHNRVFGKLICNNIMFAVCGYSPGVMNTTLLPIMFGHMPAGTSFRTLDHYVQGLKSGAFRQYNYAPLKNLKKYGRLSPPHYNIKNVVVPKYIFYSNSDWISTTMDLHRLMRKLPNVLGKFVAGNHKFNHLDYLIAKNVDQLIYQPIVYLMAGHL